jgi:hypothetical protein
MGFSSVDGLGDRADGLSLHDGTAIVFAVIFALDAKAAPLSRGSIAFFAAPS